MKSIKVTIITNFFILMFSIVVFSNILLNIFVKKYYYDNTEEVLQNQLQVATNFYNKYFSASSLSENIYDNVDAFWCDINAQVEILDSNGKLLMDSIGIKDNQLLKTPDVVKAIRGETASWNGNVDYYDNKVMIVSRPLKSNDKIVGVIRLITSLEDVDSIIGAIQFFFLFISAIVLSVGVIISIIMANRIINPIKSLTNVAENMAAGNFKIRSTIATNDEFGKLGDTFNFMADELEKKDQLKNEFISSVSHELRTPLTAIKGWAITLNSDLTDKETLKIGFDVIEKEADRLTVMVEELLYFSRFVSGKIILKKSVVEVEALIRYVENIMRPKSVKEGIEFNVEIIKEVPTVHLDKDRMKQVLINIIDNAFKFTKPGGYVSLSVHRTKGVIKFIIKDSGCGISKEDLPRVKEKFFKGKNSKSQNGIGLSICDEIIKLHGGKFNISSTLEVGTKVEIIIPVEQEE